MKAIVYDAPGDAHVLRVAELPDPIPQADEVLVQVHATAINRADILQRLGRYDPPADASPILGLEIAGEVIEAKGRWQAGDRVMAVVTGGGYAELAAVPSGMLMPIPPLLSYPQAAAIPEAFLTAFLNLFILGDLQRGEAVLIHAGASGVGSAAIQLARINGARVFATAGNDQKLMYCESWGAELSINYKEENFALRVLEATDGRGVNMILDVVGAPYWNQNLKALAEGGRLLVIGLLGGAKGQLDMGAILAKNLTITGTRLRPMPLAEKSALSQAFSKFAMPLFDSWELVPIVDSIFPMAEVSEAHRRMENNQNIGKIVLTLPSETALENEQS